MDHGFLKAGTPESAMRLGFFMIHVIVFIAIPGGIFMAFWFNHTEAIGALAGLAVGLLTPAYAGKAGQSFAENKTPAVPEIKTQEIK